MKTVNTWAEAVEAIQPHVVRISTPQGSGTGFLVSNAKKYSICGIATAAHVVDHAHFWEEPIRIEHSGGKSMVVRRHERAIFLDSTRDTAAILFDRGGLPFPDEPFRLAPEGMFLKVGHEIGWLGYPAIENASLCFFTGNVSAWLQSVTSYLVDGVAINGVSGGPALYLEYGDIVIIGVVSAYVPNRATGEVLPGLSVVRDVSQFHELAPRFASLDQAREAETTTEPPPPPEPADSPERTPTKRTT